MVENKDQWEETEYSEEQTEDISNADDAEDQDYDDSYEEYESDGDEDEEGVAPANKKSNPLLLIIIFLIIVAAIVFILLSKKLGNNHQDVNPPANNNNYVSSEAENNNQEQEQSTNELANSFFEDASNENNNEDNNMMSVNFNEAGETNVTSGEGNNEQVATVTDTNSDNTAKESDLFDNQTNVNTENDQENNAIMVVYNKAARTNPFKPPVVAQEDKDVPFEVLNNTPFEIIEPPKESVVDENLTRLLQTQISGILYDNQSPSAIVNLNGLDHFVKVGDTISGYKIKSITKDKVEISYKNNSYVASVGELFTKGNLENQQSVANLQNKFAGRYKY